MALDWRKIQESADHPETLRQVARLLELDRLDALEIATVEGLLRDTTIASNLRREISLALLKHTRRESTQRLQVMWTGKSSDEEFRNTDEMAAITAVVGPEVYPVPDEKPTVRAGLGAMPLPPEIDVSGILSWQPDRLLELVPAHVHSLRFHRRVYENVDAEGVVSLLRRGVLLGMDVLTVDGWQRVVDATGFAPLVQAFEAEAERVMERLDVHSEVETVEDLNSTSDITRPFDPGPLFAYDQVDALLNATLCDSTITVSHELATEEDLDVTDEPPTVEFHPEETAVLPTPDTRTVPPVPAIQTRGQTQVTHSALIAAAMGDAPKPLPTARIAGIKNPRETEPNLREPMPAVAAGHQHSEVGFMRGTVALLAVASVLAVSGLSTLFKSAEPPTEITAPLEVRQAFVEASRQIRAASSLPAGGLALLAPAAQQWAAHEPAKSAALLTRLFEHEPRLSLSLDIARMHAAAGDFSAARLWLREATYLGAEAKVVVPQLREAIEQDPHLRQGPREFVPPALTTFLWDANQRQFQVVTQGRNRNVFVPHSATATALVADSRVCEILACAHRVPTAQPVKVSTDALPQPLPRGIKVVDGFVLGAMVEVVDLKVERAPVEIKAVWVDWFDARKPMPTGPYASRLLVWDEVDADLRPDFADHAATHLNSQELARQIASLFVTDYLTGNTARDERGKTVGVHTGFDGTQLVAKPSGHLKAPRLSSGVRARQEHTRRYDAFSFYALQAMTPDTMHEVLTGLEPRRRAGFERSRQQVIQHFEELMDEHGSQQILFLR